MIGLGVAGAGALGLPVLPGLLETGVAALGLGMTLRDKREQAADAILKRITAEIAAEAQAWNAETRSEGRDPGAVRAAIASVEEALPACLPPPEQVAPLWGQSDAIADLMLETAQQPRFKDRFTDTPGEPKHLARGLFRRAAIRGFSHLWTIPAFRDAHAAEMRAAILDDTAALGANLETARSEIAAILDRMEGKLDAVQEGVDDANAKLDDILALVRGQGIGDSLPLPLARDIVRAFGEKAGHLDPTAIADLLRGKAEEFKSLEERLRRLSNDDPKVDALRSKAADALEKGDFDAVKSALREARRIDAEAVEDLQERIEARRDSQIRSIVLDAEAEKVRLHYRAAAALYAEAAATVEEADAEARWNWLNEEREAFHLLGLEFGDKAALWEAAEKADAMTHSFPRHDHLRLWAKSEWGRAMALTKLGEREQSTTNLNEAVAAYRTILPVFDDLGDRESWATIQNNLGNALAMLGQRENGTAKLERAIIAYRSALEERTREYAPLQWAVTQNNLGNALNALGRRDSSATLLEQAVVAYRSALEEQTCDRVPLDWATTRNNLGNALQALGEREGDLARLEQAIEAFRDALRERTRERVPLDWAMTTANMATAQVRIGERQGDLTSIDAAIASYGEVVALFDEAAPAYAETARENLEGIRAIRARMAAG